MTAYELKIFLAQEQFLDVDTQQADALISQHEVSTARKEGLLTIAGTLVIKVLFYQMLIKFNDCRFYFINEIIRYR
jgi:hypothetical protein